MLKVFTPRQLRSEAPVAFLFSSRVSSSAAVWTTLPANRLGGPSRLSATRLPLPHVVPLSTIASLGRTRWLSTPPYAPCNAHTCSPTRSLAVACSVLFPLSHRSPACPLSLSLSLPRAAFLSSTLSLGVGSSAPKHAFTTASFGPNARSQAYLKKDIDVYEFKMFSFFRNLTYVLLVAFVVATASNATADYIVLQSDQAREEGADKRQFKHGSHLFISAYFLALALLGIRTMRRTIRRISLNPDTHRVRITVMGFRRPLTKEYRVDAVIPSYARIGLDGKIMQLLVVVDDAGRADEYLVVPVLNKVDGTGRTIGNTLFVENHGDGMDAWKVMKGVYKPPAYVTKLYDSSRPGEANNGR